MRRKLRADEFARTLERDLGGRLELRVFPSRESGWIQRRRLRRLFGAWYSLTPPESVEAVFGPFVIFLYERRGTADANPADLDAHGIQWTFNTSDERFSAPPYWCATKQYEQGTVELRWFTSEGLRTDANFDALDRAVSAAVDS